MISTLSQLVSTAESSGINASLRYEPAFVPDIANIRRCVSAHKYLSVATAKVICSSSWGLYQIMGNNIYSLGYNDSIFSFWSSEDIQLAYFQKFCESLDINFTLAEIVESKEKRDTFARRYNGSLSYGDRLLNILNLKKETNYA